MSMLHARVRTTTNLGRYSPTTSSPHSSKAFDYADHRNHQRRQSSTVTESFNSCCDPVGIVAGSG
jgi:hypothetical protein